MSIQPLSPVSIRRRFLLSLAALLLGILVLGVAAFLLLGKPVPAAFGGPFTLTTHENGRLSDTDLKGTPFVVFFGYTYCPDFCPTTLFDIGEDLAALGPEANKLKVLFVTVDPQRDTPEHMKLYLSAFDPRIVGLTGTPQQIADIAKAYKVIYQRVGSGDYTMNHTVTVFLMDRKGQLFSTIGWQEPQESRLAKLRRLIAGS